VSIAVLRARHDRLVPTRALVCATRHEHVIAGPHLLLQTNASACAEAVVVIVVELGLDPALALQRAGAAERELVRQMRPVTWAPALVRRWPLLLAALLLAGSLYSLRAPVGTWIVTHELETASSAEQQTRALCRLNAWAGSEHALGYELHAFDAAGERIHPHLDGRFEDITTLVVIWTDRTQVAIELLSHDGLACAYHG
jgi:hypothetical protein